MVYTIIRLIWKVYAISCRDTWPVNIQKTWNFRGCATRQRQTRVCHDTISISERTWSAYLNSRFRPNFSMNSFVYLTRFAVILSLFSVIQMQILFLRVSARDSIPLDFTSDRLCSFCNISSLTFGNRNSILTFLRIKKLFQMDETQTKFLKDDRSNFVSIFCPFIKEFSFIKEGGEVKKQATR